jgi:RHS repeat-associated protein
VELRDATENTPLNQYVYDIWGNPTLATEQVANPFRYSGEVWVNSTDLQYLRARWYDPSIGRFMNQDTYEGDIANPLSLNLYTYVHNNPLTNIDPTGHWCTSSDGNWSHAGGCESDTSTWSPDEGHDANDVMINGARGMDLDPGTPRFGTPGYDWAGEAMFSGGATAVIATCVYSCGALVAAGDVATMGTTIGTGTVVAAKSVSMGARAWNTVKGLFGKGEGTTTLYRSVSEAELGGINSSKAFDSGYNMDGKFMATTFDDAVAWGQKMDGGNTRIISIELPTSSLSKMHFDNSRLDGIGNAYYAETEFLNSVFINVRVVK